MASLKNKPKVNATDIRGALRERFAAPAFAYLEEVGNATGNACRRHADAVAMSVWPSRGLEIHGIEIKVSRADWLKELSNPDKADSVARFCDRWWLAIGDATIVKPGELPPTWGLLVFQGGKLNCATEAAKLEPEPIDRKFVASMLRNASDSADSIRREAEITGYHRGFDAGKLEATDPDRLRDELSQLRQSLAEFEKASGVSIDRWSGGQMGAIVAKIQALRSHEVDPDLKLDSAIVALERSAQALRKERDDRAKAIEIARGAA